MLIILSQKIDSESSYSDELFNSYHYPAKYKNQIHKGDTFIYYQGNRFDKSHRYYFGVGTIGEILTTDGENYYAKLLDCQRFEKKVPIYLPDGGYIEQLEYDTVRKSINPPWQSSIRPVSQAAFDYILNAAGVQAAPIPIAGDSIEVLKEKLKAAVRDFYVEQNSAAIYRIESIAATIGRSLSTYDEADVAPTEYRPSESPVDRLSGFIEYCRTMKMSYSYKAILIMALLQSGNKDGTISVCQAAEYFRQYYSDRKRNGLPAEKRRCIYLRDDVTDKQIAANIISNPIKALLESGFFFYNEGVEILALSPEIWNAMTGAKKAVVTKICKQRLKEYFAD